ncbi:MAG TPA: Bax inhibitor-1 family protein [Desulfobacteria bacterium]|nr:Bax inhibitor-1 family protein [Desulfobacteria bacterium]
MDRETFNTKVIPLFVVSLLIATVGVLLGFIIPPVLFIPVVIAEFLILLAAFFFRRRVGIPLWMLLLFTLLTGITTAPIVYWAGVQGGTQIIFEALALTTVVFGSLAGYVYFTGRDFRSMGTFLFFALFGLILASLVNIFLNQPLFSVIIDVAVLLVFLGFVLYDMSKILRDYSEDQVTDAVLALYLDFLNIFIRILELLILSKRRR